MKITKWPERRRNAEGDVIEVLGKVGDPGVDVLSVMRQYELAESFPDDVQAEADATEREPSPEEYRGRADRRNLPIVTVDGEDSKDLDDGVYARKNEDGSYFLGVYIADVSWYVRETVLTARPMSAVPVSIWCTVSFRCCQKSCPMESAA